jgi:hypothetical protein
MHDDGPPSHGGMSPPRKATRCQLLPGPDNRGIRFAARWAITRPVGPGLHGRNGATVDDVLRARNGAGAR